MKPKPLLLLPLLLLALVGCSTPRLEPREGFVAVPGGRVWFKVVGSGPGTPLLVRVVELAQPRFQAAKMPLLTRLIASPLYGVCSL